MGSRGFTCPAGRPHRAAPCPPGTPERRIPVERRSTGAPSYFILGRSEFALRQGLLRKRLSAPMGAARLRSRGGAGCFYASSRQATPGSSLPSRNSREAHPSGAMLRRGPSYFILGRSEFALRQGLLRKRLSAPMGAARLRSRGGAGCLYASSRQATPGSSLPSRNSSEAPPPVEMWVMLSA